jgi:CBS domain-containing protein
VAAEHEPFAALLPRFVDKKRLPRHQRDALAGFASLRNAIAHGRYYDGQAIANPVEHVVVQIERLRDQIKSPPRALTGHPVPTVSIARPSDPLSVILSKVREHGYSQLPVYDDSDRYVGLLTTNAIASWLASQFEDHGIGLGEDKPISDVLPFVEPHEIALHVGREITAAEAIVGLSHGGLGGRPLPR